MKTTIDFLDELKARNGGASDYAIANLLGVTRQCISRYRKGNEQFSDSTAIRAANLLEIDPALVIMAVHAERAKKPEEKAIWEELLQRLGGLAAALALGIGLSGIPSPANANAIQGQHNMDYVNKRKKCKTTKNIAFTLAA